MQTLKQQLPPLAPLISFEAAARLRSFTAAARELNLSQAAVSQQIRNLEDSLGISLFIRAHKSVELSAKGRELQHTVSTVFQQLAGATAELKESSLQSRITVAADQSVASMWLMPRLPQFQKQFADIGVRLIASDDHRAARTG
jgi:DNA-binding transcriptional LysR family regulator